MKKQVALTAPPAWVNSRHGRAEGKEIRFIEESEGTEWKETAAIWAIVFGMIIFAAAL